MKKWFAVCFCVAVVLGAFAFAQSALISPGAPSPGASQNAPQNSPNDQSRITLDVTRVNVLFTVSDKKGRFVTNLTKDDFDVFENKKRQTILEFTAESDLPLRLGLLIDTSNSIRDRFRFEQEAASEFLNTLLRPKTDRAMIVSFDTDYTMQSELTDDHEADQGHPRSASGRRHCSVRRHFSRLPRPADERPATS